MAILEEEDGARAGGGHEQGQNEKEGREKEEVAEVAGRRVEPEDPAEFAEALRQLLAEPELAAARGAAGRRLVEERYGKEAVLEELERELMGLSLGARSAAKLP